MTLDQEIAQIKAHLTRLEALHPELLEEDVRARRAIEEHSRTPDGTAMHLRVDLGDLTSCACGYMERRPR